jgi:hypothetical protein
VRRIEDLAVREGIRHRHAVEIVLDVLEAQLVARDGNHESVGIGDRPLYRHARGLCRSFLRPDKLP